MENEVDKIWNNVKSDLDYEAKNPLSTSKINNMVKENPNKLYSLLASGRAAEHRRFGKFGKSLYIPHNPFTAEPILADILKAGDKAKFAKEKKRKDSF
jgi:hypothetical protein